MIQVGLHRKVLHQRCVNCLSGIRNLFSRTGKWPEYSDRARRDIEKLWKDRIKNHHVEQVKQAKGEKYYVLSMFPYPSGRLHMGHVRVYTISDTMARYQRMLGKQVIHPMGWDAFGLPAENAAIEKGELPRRWTESNIASMKKQLEDMCYSFDWNREYATCDPDYYKWTQHIFLKMFEAGLVYQKQAKVNWDPVDQTVLADEQIDEDGKSWRSGAKVEKKYLLQWYIRTTAYAKSLADGLNDVEPSLWKDIIKLQRHWIGDCVGTKLNFQVEDDGTVSPEPLTVYTTEPELICGVSHIALHPEHPLNQVSYHQKTIGKGTQEDTLLKICAVNPVSGAKVPLIVSKSTEFSEFLDNKLGLPCSDLEDKTLAEKFSIPYENVLKEDDDGKLSLLNSNQFTGLSRDDGFKAVMEYAKENKIGGNLTSERLNDWLISRQRYWGTPIPIIHCPKCKIVPVPYEDLPVELPMITSFSHKGASPLAQDVEWNSVKCPKCGGEAHRETDTMDTFVDSSWYYLRYLDPDNEKELCRKEKAEKFMPVDLYIGGKEHATLHLYFARFFNHFLHDQGIVSHREPFFNLLTQGMVMGQSYRVKETGKYLRKEEVDFTGKKPVERETGAPLIVEWEKMSKSKYNGADPQDVIAQFGVDSTRLCILAGVAPKTNRNWSPDFFTGILKWQSRIWKIVTNYIEQKHCDKPQQKYTPEQLSLYDAKIHDSRNYHLKEVNFHFNTTFLISVGISRLQSFTNDLMKIPPEVMGTSLIFEQAICDLVIMLSPMAPMFASELWAGLASVSNTKHNQENCVLDQSWPQMDPDYKMKMNIMMNGEDFTHVRVPFAELDQLTKDGALSYCEQNDDFKTKGLSGKVKRLDLKVVPNYMAEVNLFVPELLKKKKKKTSADKSQVAVPS